MVRSLRFSPSRYLSMLVTAGEFLKTMKTSAPRLKIFVATETLMPLTKRTTAITAATPITTPSKVSAERSLFAHNDRNAILMSSVIFMARSAGVRSQAPGHLLLAAGSLSGYQFSSTALGFYGFASENSSSGVYSASVLCGLNQWMDGRLVRQSGGRAGTPGAPRPSLTSWKQRASRLSPK